MAGSRELVEVAAHELRDGDRDGSLMTGRRIVGVPRALDDGRVEVVMQWSRGRQEKARLDPDRKFRVKRITVGAGLPVRHRAKARTTRGTIEVHDTAHPEATVTAAEARGHRWAMRCEHGTVVGRQTLSAALEDVTDPRLWCVSCVPPMPGALPLPL